MKRCDVGNNKWAHEERDRHQNTRNRGGGKAEGKKDPPFCGKSGKTIWRKRHLPKRCAKLKQIGAVRLLMLKAKPIRVGLPLRLHWLPRMAIPAVLQAPGNRNRHVFIFVHPKSYNKEPHTRQHVQTPVGALTLAPESWQPLMKRMLLCLWHGCSITAMCGKILVTIWLQS